jgi:hypothetical protein
MSKAIEVPEEVYEILATDRGEFGARSAEQGNLIGLETSIGRRMWFERSI